MAVTDKDVIWFEELTIGDVGIVGGKNASLGEMVRELAPKGIEVPPGFATSADAFRRYITANALDGTIAQAMERLGSGKATLQETGTRIRQAILEGEWPEDTEAAIREAYAELARRTGKDEPSVAVRSSATAEDLPDASFAGQQETFLNVVGIDRCSTPAGAATPRSSPTGRSPTASSRASTGASWRSRSASSSWRARTSAARA
jgi:pyruvate, water dikinase